jgi:hypothetical protein
MKRISILAVVTLLAGTAIGCDHKFSQPCYVKAVLAPEQTVYQQYVQGHGWYPIELEQMRYTSSSSCRIVGLESQEKPCLYLWYQLKGVSPDQYNPNK